MDNINDVGEHIRLARVTANLTQKEFAEKVGISRTYLGQLEKGTNKPSYDLMEKLSVYVPELRRGQQVKRKAVTMEDFVIDESKMPPEWHEQQAIKSQASRAKSDEQMRLHFIERISLMLGGLTLHDAIEIFIKVEEMLGIAPDTDTDTEDTAP